MKTDRATCTSSTSMCACASVCSRLAKSEKAFPHSTPARKKKSPPDMFSTAFRRAVLATNVRQNASVVLGFASVGSSVTLCEEGSWTDIVKKDRDGKMDFNASMDAIAKQIGEKVGSFFVSKAERNLILMSLTFSILTVTRSHRNRSSN